MKSTKTKVLSLILVCLFAVSPVSAYDINRDEEKGFDERTILRMTSQERKTFILIGSLSVAHACSSVFGLGFLATQTLAGMSPEEQASNSLTLLEIGKAVAGYIYDEENFCVKMSEYIDLAEELEDEIRDSVGLWAYYGW